LKYQNTSKKKYGGQADLVERRQLNIMHVDYTITHVNTRLTQYRYHFYF